MSPTLTIEEANLDFERVANLFIAIAFLAAAILCIAYIIWGGISFILSGGQDERIQSAVQTIRYAIIGLIITFLALIIVGFIGRLFGLDLTYYFSSDTIVQLIQDIINGFDGNTNTTTNTFQMSNTGVNGTINAPLGSSGTGATTGSQSTGIFGSN